MKAITSVEIINHGPDGEQYFPGCGVSGTPHTHVVTGMGGTLREALEDALEQAPDAEGGGPYATLERHVEEHVAMLDANCHTDHEANADEACCLIFHYASIRWTVETVEVALDNEDHTDGFVLVTLPQGQEYDEAADDDRTIDGSTWEDSGDYSPYTLLVDRASLVKALQEQGYQLDLGNYTDPNEKEVTCASCGTNFILANARHREDDGALLCKDECTPCFFANVVDKDGQDHKLQATSLYALAGLASDVNPGAQVRACDAQGFARGWVGPNEKWEATS